MTSMTTALKDHLAQQVTLEYQRKSAIESKSFSILTATLAFVTLYIALSNQTQLSANLRKSAPRDFLLVALIAAVLAIIAALWAARPIAYSTVRSEDLDDTRKRLAKAREPTGDPDELDSVAIDTPDSISDELLEAQIRDLKNARAINTCRARILYTSLILVGIEIAGLITSLSLAASY